MKKAGWMLVFVALLGGCATKSHVRQPPHAVIGHPDYERVTFQELSAYLGYLAKLPDAQRRLECRWLQRYDSIDDNPGVKLHLALALLVSPDCHEATEAIRQALALFDTVLPRVSDPDLRYFLLYHRQLARRMFSDSHRERELARKIGRIRRDRHALKQRLRACEKESQNLNAKLEALRALENTLNHRIP